VTDHGRSRMRRSARICAPVLRHVRRLPRFLSFLVCSVCGRPGVYIQPFHSGG
jgi:hypothetical protein